MSELLPVVTHAFRARMGISQSGLSCLLDLKYDSDPCLKTNHRLFHLQLSPPALPDFSPMPHFTIGSEASAMKKSATECQAAGNSEFQDMQRANLGAAGGDRSDHHEKMVAICLAIYIRAA